MASMGRTSAPQEDPSAGTATQVMEILLGGTAQPQRWPWLAYR